MYMGQWGLMEVGRIGFNNIVCSMFEANLSAFVLSCAGRDKR